MKFLRDLYKSLQFGLEMARFCENEPNLTHEKISQKIKELEL